MKKRPRVILYGDTLVLAGMRTSLEASPAFEVIALEVAHAAEQDLLWLRPDVIIFDTGSVQPQFHYNLIQQRSGLQLIGIDPDRDQVLLWSGQQLHELSVQDLVNVIQPNKSNSEPLKRRIAGADTTHNPTDVERSDSHPGLLPGCLPS